MNSQARYPCDIGGAVLRAYRPDDAVALQAIAGEFAVARWMTENFVHPYTLADAQAWIATTARHDPVQALAIEVAGQLAGGVGLHPRTGSHTGVAVVGYWLGTGYWGRGIATAAVRKLVADAFADGFRRVEAHVFANNLASVRVLEKCGFQLEARLRDSYIERDATPTDELIFATFASSATPPALER